MIKNYVIYGERCSGTNFLENTIKMSFDLKGAWPSGGVSVPRKDWDYSGHKHFFGFIDDRIKIHNDTLFIGIVRNPYQWMMSLKKKEYHFHHLVKEDNNHNFLYHELSSLHLKRKEIIYDRNFLTNKDPNIAKRFKNIFELRKIKCQYLIDTMPKISQNYYFLRYEDLVNSYTDIIEHISDKFKILIKNANATKVKRPKNHDIIDIDYLNSHIDWDTENKIKYHKNQMYPF
jgi:hypothetical protein